MGVKFARLIVSHENKRRLREDCKEEFLRNNPKFKGMFLTEEFLVTKIIDYYLDENE